MEKDFFTEYLEFVDLENQEAPAIYHRWTLASCIGSLLGRQFYLPFGKHIIYPNQFIMLMGTPGTRKGSAMNVGKEILKAAGYNRFAASRTSLERFLIDMKQLDESPANDLEEFVLDSPSESYIMAGEFVDFIGPNDIAFINLLTNLWDNLGEYRHPKIQGKSVEVYKPTVNLFGGSTPQTFAIAFPPEVIGTGFLSRLLLIHAEPTGKKIAWPSITDALVLEQLVAHFRAIRETIKGEASFSAEAKKIAGEIYANEVHVDDNRFTFYQQRRHIHMLKLAIIHAAANLSTVVEKAHVIRANTMLARAERWMPKALGEFGKNRYAEATQEVLQFLSTKTMPATATDIFKAVSRSISKMPELLEIIANLKTAEKIRIVELKGKAGYMAYHKEAPKWKDHLVDMSWLTVEETF
jgi:hypothetical protein